MIRVTGRMECFDDSSGKSVRVTLDGRGPSVEAALGAALADGEWRDRIARPVQHALDLASGRAALEEAS